LRDLFVLRNRKDDEIVVHRSCNDDRGEGEAVMNEKANQVRKAPKQVTPLEHGIKLDVLVSRRLAACGRD
jgi:hypothetical protein